MAGNWSPRMFASFSSNKSRIDFCACPKAGTDFPSGQTGLMVTQLHLSLSHSARSQHKCWQVKQRAANDGNVWGLRWLRSTANAQVIKRCGHCWWQQLHTDWLDKALKGKESHLFLSKKHHSVDDFKVFYPWDFPPRTEYDQQTW